MIQTIENGDIRIMIHYYHQEVYGPDKKYKTLEMEGHPELVQRINWIDRVEIFNIRTKDIISIRNDVATDFFQLIGQIKNAAVPPINFDDIDS